MTKMKHEPATDWPIEVIRSTKRRKTVSAELKDGILVIRAPASMSDAELAPIIERLQKRLHKKTRPVWQTDEELELLAQKLNKRYFQDQLRWHSIRYVTNQTKRYGSCTPNQKTIRISHRVAAMPKWVQRYVVLHELAHLEEANHGKRFWRLVNQYPLTERARGYLMAAGLEDESDQE
jgi:predicted metal-dependent hydrolase